MEQNRFQFNMDQIGRKISAFRKEQNMTQMELADKLGISFQAVSNWERGNTMPDISKLPELAEIFHVTTDELLGEASGLVRSAAKGEMEQYMAENPVTVEEFTQAAPLLTPDQAEAGFEKLTEQTPHLSLSDLEDILPHIGRGVVDELALKYADSPDWKDLDEIAPFVSGHVLEQIAEKLVAQGKNIEDIVPFLSAECVTRMALMYMEASEWGKLEDIAPFLNRQVLEQIADRLAETGEYSRLEDFFPFLADETRARLAQRAYEEKGINGVEDFMPFLSGEMRQSIAQKEFDKNGLRGLEDIAPFLDRGYLNGLAKEAIEKDGIKAISPIAPFLDREMLTRFVREKYL